METRARDDAERVPGVRRGILNEDEVAARVVSVVKNFAKVDASKVTATSAFAGDLGLDSLDTVEVVMAMEEEFAVEIPDAEADKIQSIPEAVSYLAATRTRSRRDFSDDGVVAAKALARGVVSKRAKVLRNRVYVVTTLF